MKNQNIKIEEIKIKTINVHKKGYVELAKGERNRLHTDLSAIDNVDCKFLYEPYHKIIYVEYKPEMVNNTKIYTKQLICPANTPEDIHTVVKDINEHVKETV